MSSINIFFYSNSCPGSQVLNGILRNENLLRFFHQICTDNNPDIPSQITRTPTLIIRNVPTPYVAGDAFSWVTKIKQWKITAEMQKMSGAQQKYLQGMSANLNMNINSGQNFMEYSQMEMGGSSDIFAYLQEGAPATPQSFFDCGNLGKESIFTPPTEESKIKEDKQRKLQSKLLEDRKKQDSIFKQNIDAFVKQYK